MLMDVVYPLRRSQGPFQELRFSLRSLRNLPHGRVVLVGGCPAWARDVSHLDAVKQPTPYRDSANNVRVACLSDEVSDPFILMNDDFFVVDPVDTVPVLNSGSARDTLARLRARGINNPYIAGLQVTMQELALCGYREPVSYELHVPMIVHKEAMLEAVSMGARFEMWQMRTAYGNLAAIGGETVSDVKVADLHAGISTHVPFVSTSDRSFKVGRIGYEIRRRFTESTEYES